MGWRTPYSARAVCACLAAAREDGNPAVRLAACGALARLGERRALQWFRQRLVGDGDTPAPRAIRQVAAEGLTLLWPDLNQLAETEDAEVAHHAREALEQLREEALAGSSARPGLPGKPVGDGRQSARCRGESTEDSDEPTDPRCTKNRSRSPWRYPDIGLLLRAAARALRR